jgi:hypothetical protein
VTAPVAWSTVGHVTALARAVANAGTAAAAPVASNRTAPTAPAAIRPFSPFTATASDSLEFPVAGNADHLAAGLIIPAVVVDARSSRLEYTRNGRTAAHEVIRWPDGDSTNPFGMMTFSLFPERVRGFVFRLRLSVA